MIRTFTTLTGRFNSFQKKFWDENQKGKKIIFSAKVHCDLEGIVSKFGLI